MNRASMTPSLTLTHAAAALAFALAAAAATPTQAQPPSPSPAGAASSTASGLGYTEKVAGKGASPSAEDTVSVHYVGRFPDGREFDSSVARGKPAEFPLNRVIKCWTEGVQKMKVGGKATLVCPPAIAYGERGAGGTIPPNATLHFDIELLGIVKR